MFYLILYLWFSTSSTAVGPGIIPAPTTRPPPDTTTLFDPEASLDSYVKTIHPTPTPTTLPFAPN